MNKFASRGDMYMYVCPNRKFLLKPAKKPDLSSSVKCAKHCEKGTMRPEEMTGYESHPALGEAV